MRFLITELPPRVGRVMRVIKFAWLPHLVHERNELNSRIYRVWLEGYHEFWEWDGNRWFFVIATLNNDIYY